MNSPQTVGIAPIVSSNAPPLSNSVFSVIPVVHELSCLYETIHRAIQDFPKLEKYSLGIALEKMLLECVEHCFSATVMPRGALKIQAVAAASAGFDTLKVYLRLAIHSYSLDEKEYIKMIPRLGSIGSMLGGWLKEVNKANPKPNLQPPES